MDEYRRQQQLVPQVVTSLTNSEVQKNFKK